MSHHHLHLHQEKWLALNQPIQSSNNNHQLKRLHHLLLQLLFIKNQFKNNNLVRIRQEFHLHHLQVLKNNLNSKMSLLKK